MSRTPHLVEDREPEGKTRRGLLRAGVGACVAASGCLGAGDDARSAADASAVRERRYTISVDGQRARLSVDVPAAAYDRAQDRPRSFSRAMEQARSSDLLHRLGAQIAAAYGTVNGRLLAARAAVTAIPYSADVESTGTGEYVRYPVETLTEQTGDCEDLAILLAGVLASPALGFRTGLVVTEGHCAALVARADLEPAVVAAEPVSVTVSGTEYLYLEATDRSPPGELGASTVERPLLAAYLDHWYPLDMPGLRAALAEALRSDEIEYAWQFVR